MSQPHPDQLPSLPPQPPGPHQGGALALRHPNAGALSTQVLQPRAEEATADDDEIDLKAIWRTLVKHRWMLLGITALCVVAAGIYTLRVTPQYEASAMVQIDRAAQKVVGFGNEVEVDQGAASDQLQLRTQIELLKSRALAERVIDELGLYRRSSTAPLPGQDQLNAAGATATMPGEASTTEAEEPGLLTTLGNNLRQLFTPASADEQVLSREETIKEFQKAVTIQPVRSSRLVAIDVLNPDPELAARIANTMARSFINMSLERKADSSSYALQFLQGQIAQTKAKLEESERQINEYAKTNEILNLGDKGNAATQNFMEFAQALAKAEQERLKAEALYNEVKLNPESAPRVLDNLAVQRYKEEKAKIEAEYAKNLAVYKPDFPAMLQLKQQVEQLDARINTEITTILASIKGQYDAAKALEDQIRARMDDSRTEVLAVQDRSVDLNLLKRELDTNRQVYDSLLQRLKEVSVTASITTNNVSVVDEARPALFPAKPRPVINLGLGLVLGLFAGMLAALLREQMDDSIKHADEVEGVFGLPLLGWIPMTKQPKGDVLPSVALLAHTDPRSAFAEAYRSMRTSLQFSTANGAPKRFVVTSCGKSEGKTTTALALAINFAQLGQRVLLIDADMRKSAVHKALGMPNEKGLSNLLTGDAGTENLIRPTQVPNLSVLTAGPTPPDPVELLMGPKLGLLLDKADELGFTQVVIDGPPLLGIADAVVLGNQVQHMVFVVKASSTKKDSIRDALRRLRNAGVAPMGVALTHARNEHTSDYAYESYYGYGDAHVPNANPTAPVPAGQALPGAARVEPTLDRPATQA
ncbi:GumC family protein [Hydrogenophaga sp.]|uniref:GumC family protein n=1 Tax=Hydrogenophaga sp. TaxID=1904254 RepID=UPI0035AF8041